MNTHPTYNTYISVTMYVSHTHGYRAGTLYTSNKAANLNLYLNISYDQAKREMAKLMLRTGKMPEIRRDADSALYMFDTFLD